MKKILKLLLLTILFIPYIVKADMGAPILKPYDMVVTNQNGIDYYGYENSQLVIKGHLNTRWIIIIKKDVMIWQKLKLTIMNI